MGRRDPVELALFAALALIAAWAVVYLVWQADANGLVWTGEGGYFPVDQYQYMAWVRDASHHVLVSDLYVLRPTTHDYLEPLVVFAGGLTAVGMAPWLALLACAPGTVVAVFAAVRAWCRALLPGAWERRAALALALFYGTLGALGDEWIPFMTWGYLPAVLAIAAMTGALVAYDRAAAGRGRVWLPGALGLLASWLHPWQGEELFLIGVALGVLGGRRRLRLTGLTLAGTGLPLAYYALLEHADPIWRLADAAGGAHWPLGDIVVPLAPLLVLAALGFVHGSGARGARGARGPRGALGALGPLDAAARLWPAAALAEYGLVQVGVGSVPLHAFNGITVPLAVLAVQGVRSLGLGGRVPGYRWLAAAAVVAATVPVTVNMLAQAPNYLGPRVSNGLITHDEQRALDFLARDRMPGGVLTTAALGEIVPVDTDRRTYLGDCYWSLPDCQARVRRAYWLFGRGADPGRAAARRFVKGTGARFVLAPCSTSPALARDLAPVVASTWRRGCVAVYTLRG